MSEYWRQTQAPSSLRTKPRIQPEIIVRYTTLPSIDLGSVLVTAPDTCEYSPNGDESLPSGANNYGLWGVVKYPLGNAQLTLSLTGSKGGSGSIQSDMTFEALWGLDQAMIGSNDYGWNTVDSVTADGGTANDWIHLWGIPDIDQFTELSYITSVDIAPGSNLLPVPNKFDTQKAVILQRRTSGLTITRNYVDADDINDMLGREITLLLEYRPQGTGFVSEYIVFPKARLTPSVSNPDNALTTAPYEGGSNNYLAYQPHQ
jgi:hypothetical protein